MNRIYAAAIALPLVLAGCQGISPADQANAVACMSTLLGSGSTDPGTLARLATVTPSCQALAASVLADLLNRVPAQNAKAMNR